MLTKNKNNPSAIGAKLQAKMLIGVLKTALKGKKKLQVTILICIYLLIYGAVSNVFLLIDLIKSLF